ncbi:reverse transcriptase domain-containing protein, partial [Tanacetum coccineum]
LFIFSKECIKAFETLKMKLTQDPILVAPDWDLPFEIMCDASDFAVGAVLRQRKDIKDKKKQKQSKTDKKRKRQVKSEGEVKNEANDQSRISPIQQERNPII